MRVWRCSGCEEEEGKSKVTGKRAFMKSTSGSMRSIETGLVRLVEIQKQSSEPNGQYSKRKRRKNVCLYFVFRSPNVRCRYDPN